MKRVAGASVAAAALITLALAGCATDDRPEPPPAELISSTAPHDGEREQERGGRTARPLFISPAGEPFHGSVDGPPPVAVWFAAADRDHDGRLSRAEFVADYERFFRRLDANGDGVIDGFETQAYERTIAPELLPDVGRLRAGEGQDESLFKGGRGGRAGRGARGRESATGPRGRAGGAGVHTAGAYQLFPDLEPITAADANLDGRVSLAEWRARAEAVFAQLDTASAGLLTLAALPKTPQQLQNERRRAAQAGRGS